MALVKILVLASIFLMITSLTLSCEFGASSHSQPWLRMVSHLPSDGGSTTSMIAHDTSPNHSIGLKEDGGEEEKEVRLETSDGPGSDFTVELLVFCVIVLLFWVLGNYFAYGLVALLVFGIMIVFLMAR